MDGINRDQMLLQVMFYFLQTGVITNEEVEWAFQQISNMNDQKLAAVFMESYYTAELDKSIKSYRCFN